MAQAEINRLDIGEYAAANPASEVLGMLAVAANVTNRHEAERLRNGWWERVCDEYESGVLRPSETVAAYAHVMRPYDESFPEQTAVDQTRRLTAGQQVVQHREGGSFGHGYRVDFNPDQSGTLTLDATALLGHPDNRTEPRFFPKVLLGLSFSDRADMQEVDPATSLAIGADEITDLYAKALGPRGKIWAESGFNVFAGRLKNAAVMQRLGLIEGQPTFEEERSAVVDDAATAILRSLSKSNTVHLYRQTAWLPEVHTLDTEKGEELIERIAGRSDQPLDGSVESALATAVARIRAPKVLNSVSEVRRRLYNAEATVEILKHRVALES